MSFPEKRADISGGRWPLDLQHSMINAPRRGGQQPHRASHIHPQFSPHPFPVLSHSDQSQYYPPYWEAQVSMAPRIPLTHRQPAAAIPHSSAASIPSLFQGEQVHSCGRVRPILPPMQQGQSFEPVYGLGPSGSQGLAVGSMYPPSYSDQSLALSRQIGASDPHQARQPSERPKAKAAPARQKPYPQKGRLPKSDPCPVKQQAMPKVSEKSNLPSLSSFKSSLEGLSSASSVMHPSASAHDDFSYDAQTSEWLYDRKKTIDSATATTSSMSQSCLVRSESQALASVPVIKKAKKVVSDADASVRTPLVDRSPVIRTVAHTPEQYSQHVREICDVAENMCGSLFGLAEKYTGIPKDEMEYVFWNRLSQKRASKVNQSDNVTAIPVTTSSDKEVKTATAGSTSWNEILPHLELSSEEYASCSGVADLDQTGGLRSLDLDLVAANNERQENQGPPSLQRSQSFPGGAGPLDKKREKFEELKKRRLESGADDFRATLQSTTVCAASQIAQPSENLPSLGTTFSGLSLDDGNEMQHELTQAASSNVVDVPEQDKIKKSKGRPKKGTGKKRGKKKQTPEPGSSKPGRDTFQLQVPRLVIRRQSEQEYVVNTAASGEESYSSGQLGQAGFSAEASVESALFGHAPERSEASSTKSLLLDLLAQSDESSGGGGVEMPLLERIHTAGSSVLEQQPSVPAGLSHPAPLRQFGEYQGEDREDHGSSSSGGRSLDVLAQVCAQEFNLQPPTTSQ